MALMDFLGSNTEFGSALQRIGQQDTQYRNNQHLQKVFAANPAYATALYGAKNQLADNDLNQKLALLKLQKMAQGGDLPAALQLTNAYLDAQRSGDTQKTRALELFSKIYDKGVAVDPNSGQISPLANYGPSVASIAADKAGMTQQAEKNVDLQMNPLIKKETERQGILGKDEGESEALYNSMVSRMPQLENTAERLSALGKLATYTYSGQARDALIRQAGRKVPDSAIARAEYISMVDNEILPLLRETFGAQFTQKEGESLKVTLGDPNKSPEEKDAVLRSFIRSKMESVNTLARKTGKPTYSGGLNSPQGGEVPLGGEKTIVKRLYSPSTKKTKIIYSDGTEEIQ